MKLPYPQLKEKGQFAKEPSFHYMSDSDVRMCKEELEAGSRCRGPCADDLQSSGGDCRYLLAHTWIVAEEMEAGR